MSQHGAIAEQKRVLRHQTAQADLNTEMLQNLPTSSPKKAGNGLYLRKHYFHDTVFTPSAAPGCFSHLLHHREVILQRSLAPQIPGSKENFPGKLAQAGIKHRMAWLKGISGWDQSRRHVAQVSSAASVSPTSDKVFRTTCPGAAAAAPRLPRPISAWFTHHANSSPIRLSCLEAISTYTSDIWSIFYALQLRSRHSPCVATSPFHLTSPFAKALVPI